MCSCYGICFMKPVSYGAIRTATIEKFLAFNTVNYGLRGLLLIPIKLFDREQCEVPNCVDQMWPI